MKLLLSVLTLALSLTVLADTKRGNTTGASQLDDLIRGEMSAVKTYDQVINKLKNDKERTKLSAFRQDHQRAVEKLKKHASKNVKEDTDSSGVWGAFATTWTGGASLFGDKTAVKALNQGEEHGLREYKEALEDENISSEVKTLIKTELMPKQQEHVKAMKRYL